MTEFKIGNATVRMHGTPDKEQLKASTEKFMKKVERRKKKCSNITK